MEQNMMSGKQNKQSREMENFLNSNKIKELTPEEKLEQAKNNESKMCQIF